MRTLLLASILALSSLPATSRSADACGSYVREPTVLPVLTAGAGNRRSFVLLDRRLPAAQAKQLRFTTVDRKSYDDTQTAPGDKLARPLTITLVGPSGRKVIHATSSVWIDMPFGSNEVREGIALPKGDYSIALYGDVTASWQDFAVTSGETSTVFRAPDVAVTVMAGGATTLTTTYGGQDYDRGSLEGWPQGIVSHRGMRYVVVSGAVPNTMSLVAI